MPTQEEGEHREDEHQASAEHHQQGQAHFGDMALGLDQHMPHGLEHGFSLADYQYDGGELGTPPDGPPVLNSADQSLMNSFFNDPNGVTSNLVPFDTGLPHDHDAVNGGFAFAFGNGSMNPSASGGAGPSSLHHKGHANGSAPFSHVDNWNNQQHMNADDFSAANTIHNLKSPTPNYSNIQLAGGISASWGNFAMPTPIPNLHMSNNIPNVPGQPQLRAVPTQTRHHSFTYPNQPIFTHSQMFMPPESEAAHGHQQRPRHMSYSEHSAPQWHNLQQAQYQHGHHMTFGTDTSFTGGHYQSDQAAKHPHSYRNMGDQQQNGAPGQGNSKSPNGAGASQWGNMTTAPKKQDEGEFADSRERKRRKSQMDSQEGGDYAYQRAGRVIGEEDEDEAESAHKRRKSTTMAALPDSPDGDDSNKRKKKMRETLTDAEKRKHHIMSEKKRRELINNGFNDLTNMVPCLSTGKSGLSRSEVLQEIASYLETLKMGNIKLTGAMRNWGLDPDGAAPPPIKTEDPSSAFGT